MKDPDVKIFAGTTQPTNTCYALPTGKYRIAEHRRTSVLVKDVDEAAARLFCAKHKITFPE